MTDSAVEQNTRMIDGLSLPLLQPNSVAEVGETIQKARAAGEAIYPVGGGTQLGFGLPPTKKGVAVALTKFNRVMDYPARDMTITVEAGMTIGELQRILSEENQRLPVDIPHSPAATLGGALATNTSGLRRYGFGTLRDYVIGITVLNDEGEQVKAGGRVVKNVAGYDLCKLYIGSLGTLCIISQITLKVVPRPEQNALIILQCHNDQLGKLLDRLHESQSRPVCIEALNRAAAMQMQQDFALDLPDADWVVIAGFEGNSDRVNWQVQQLVKELHFDYHLEARLGPTADPLWHALVEFPGWSSTGLTWKAATLPSQCAELCQQTSALPEVPLLQAHAGNGIVMGHLKQDITQQQTMDVVKGCREITVRSGGSVVLMNCPTAWKEEELIWGKPQENFSLMRTVKERLDPQRIFNPGRFCGGI